MEIQEAAEQTPSAPLQASHARFGSGLHTLVTEEEAEIKYKEARTNILGE